MINEEIITFIEQQLSLGVDNDAIVLKLEQSGWNDQDIASAFNEIASRIEPPIPPGTPEVNESLAQSPESYSMVTQNPSRISTPFIVLMIGIVIVILLGGYTYFKNNFGQVSQSVAIDNSQTQVIPYVVINTPNEQGGVLDCGTDYACFAKAGASCTPASVTSTRTRSFGFQETVTTFSSIKAVGTGSCNLYMKTEKVDIVPPQGQPLSAQSQSLIKKVEGRDGNCIFKTSDLASLLIKRSQGIYDSGKISCTANSSTSSCVTTGGDYAKAVCTGTLFQSTL